MLPRQSLRFLLAGDIGAHGEAVRRSYDDFEALAQRIYETLRREHRIGTRMNVRRKLIEWAVGPILRCASC